MSSGSVSNKEEDQEQTETLLKKLEILGEGGWYLWKIFLLCMIPSVLNGLNLTSYVYLAEVPQHWCLIPELEQTSWLPGEIRNISSPNEGNSSSCTMYNWDYNLLSSMSYDEAFTYTTTHDKPDIVACSKYQYDESVSSMVRTYDLVCERTALKSSVQVALSLGKFLGAFLFGVLADKYGRRMSFLIGTIIYIISGPFVAYAYSYIMMIIGRIGLGAAGSGIYQSAYVILSEISNSRRRAGLSIIYNMSYPIGQMIVPLIAYYIWDWRTLQMVISAPSIVIILFYWLLPESPRWLISKGKLKEAGEIINKELSETHHRLLVETLHKKPDDEPKDSSGKRVEFNDVPESSSSKSHSSEMIDQSSGAQSFLHKIISTLHQLIELLKYSELRNRLFIMLFCWCICSLCYYALALNVDNFHSDRYIYGFLTGLVEVPSYLLPLPFLKYLGRRQTSVILFFAAGFALLSILAMPHTDGESNLMLLVTASIGRLCVSSVFAVVILYTSELFPTPVRNTAVGCGSTSSHIGSMSAPFVVDLLGAYAWFVPSTLCGVCALLAGAVIFLLPETKNQELPELVDTVRRAPKVQRTGLHQICV